MIDIIEDKQAVGTTSEARTARMRPPTSDVRPETEKTSTIATRVRKSLVATILADACKDATRYVYSYVAGRGAE